MKKITTLCVMLVLWVNMLAAQAEERDTLVPQLKECTKFAFGLIYDRTGSMKDSSAVDAMCTLASSIRNMNPVDSMILIEIIALNNQYQEIQAMTENKETLISKIEEMCAVKNYWSSNTKINPALEKVEEDLMGIQARDPDRHLICVIGSDCKWHDMGDSKETIERMRKKGVYVYIAQPKGTYTGEEGNPLAGKTDGIFTDFKKLMEKFGEYPFDPQMPCN